MQAPPSPPPSLAALQALTLICICFPPAHAWLPRCMAWAWLPDKNLHHIRMLRSA